MTIVKFQKGITTKMFKKRVTVLVYCTSFYEVSLKNLEVFQVIEWTRNDHFQIAKGNNYKTV